MGRPISPTGDDVKQQLAVEARTVYRLASETTPPHLAGLSGGLARHTPWWQPEAPTIDEIRLAYSLESRHLELTTNYGNYDLDTGRRALDADRVRETRAWHLTQQTALGRPGDGPTGAWHPTVQSIDGIDHPAHRLDLGNRSAIVCCRPGVPALALELDRDRNPIAVVSSYDHTSIRTHSML